MVTVRLNGSAALQARLTDASLTAIENRDVAMTDYPRVADEIVLDSDGPAYRVERVIWRLDHDAPVVVLG